MLSFTKMHVSSFSLFLVFCTKLLILGKKTIFLYRVPFFTCTSMKFYRYRSNIMQFYTLPFELWEICMFFTQSIIFLLMPMIFIFFCRKRDIHSVWRCQILPLWRCASPLVDTSGVTFTFFAVMKMKNKTLLRRGL